MKVRCDYCRQMIDDGLEKCPHCGAAITKNRMAKAEPQTIEELKQWYVEHNLPPEGVTRFFIGRDYREPKAFGIYQADDGDFVVYKNKADGERAIRYQGSDEAYAVNELYQRLKAEIADQKQRNEGRHHSSSEKKSALGRIVRGFGIYICIAAAITAVGGILDHSPREGYYRYNGRDYYYQNSSWYEYDSDSDNWGRASNESELSNEITEDNDYEYSTYGNDGTRFEDTSWYDAGDDDDDWDSDSNWDSGDSWDSGSTDWDSDW